VPTAFDMQPDNEVPSSVKPPGRHAVLVPTSGADARTVPGGIEGLKLRTIRHGVPG